MIHTFWPAGLNASLPSNCLFLNQFILASSPSVMYLIGAQTAIKRPICCMVLGISKSSNSLGAPNTTASVHGPPSCNSTLGPTAAGLGSPKICLTLQPSSCSACRISFSHRNGNRIRRAFSTSTTLHSFFTSPKEG
ncbi:hypothetical protein Vretimale_17382 [Volvox reticuliferus]|uniref:Uncharacterized protein n=1 Tax=Volvox reticuliferus TaxID=1737510 RepID=A0A8J4GUR6_9CHLO|nr:hypothetical protein Vretimale_17382 [Volvox reticuliferus]